MRSPRTVSPAVRELLVLLGLMVVTAIYLAYILEPRTGAVQWGRTRSGEWLLRILWIAYSVWVLRMGFAKEAESISYKTQWFHIICGFVVVGLVLLIVLAPAAFVFLSIFPGYWGAAAGLVLVAGVIWFARWGIR